MKKFSLYLAILMLFSCVGLSPAQKLEVTKQSFKGAIISLQHLEKQGHLRGAKLATTKVIVRDAHTAIKLWNDYVLLFKRADMEPVDRPDLQAVVYKAIEHINKLSQEYENEKD